MPTTRTTTEQPVELRETPSELNVAIATVVTFDILDEFLVLFRSFVAFYGDAFQWFLRCDTQAAQSLSTFVNVQVEIMNIDKASFVGHPPLVFRAIVEEKFNAIDFAWSARSWSAVIYIDSDVIITGRFLDEAMRLPGDVVLTPHYYAAWLSMNIDNMGFYNTGFVLSRDKSFNVWWRNAFTTQPHRFVDQAILNDVQHFFSVSHLDERSNIGHWRRPHQGGMPVVSDDCLFLHVHLFQAVHSLSEHGLAQKTFALECLDFLQASSCSEHRLILDYILSLDVTGYYSNLLNRRVAVVTNCEPERAIRAILMARTLPRQVPVYCIVHGELGLFTSNSIARATYPLPTNLHLVHYSDTFLEELLTSQAGDSPTWLLVTDIDYVFPLGFWFLIWQFRPEQSRVPTIVCPAAYHDPNGRYLHEGLGADTLKNETESSHLIPRTFGMLDMAQPLVVAMRWDLKSRRSSKVVSDAVDISSPAVLLRASDIPKLIDGFQIQVVPNCFIFHLWHSPQQESPFVGWQEQLSSWRS